MIDIIDLHKAFKKNKVLKGVNLHVDPGEVVIIIGPSGSGKSTMLRCINYLERPNRGIIRVDDLKVDARNVHSKQIVALRNKTAMVFQHYNLFKNKTAVENAMEGLIVAQKMDKKLAYDTGVSYLEKVGLLDKLNEYPAKLSGGQKQRVGIARALALNPKVILFDDPTSALDPELVGEVLEVMKDVAKEGMTMIVVTHEISFAREVADHVYFMDDGIFVEDGKPSELINSSRVERTRRFLSRVTLRVT